jgi:two-component system, NarL family, nitrate/nitrite response regulator NarL
VARRPLPDVLLLDSALANRINGTASSWSSTRIILLANTINREHVVQALRLGACGIVPDTSPPQVVLKSIRTVLADQYWLDADAIAMLLGMIRQLLGRQLEQFDNKCLTLTPR